MPIFTSQIKIDGEDYERLLEHARSTGRSPEEIIGARIGESLSAWLAAEQQRYDAELIAGFPVRTDPILPKGVIGFEQDGKPIGAITNIAETDDK